MKNRPWKYLHYRYLLPSISIIIAAQYLPSAKIYLLRQALL